MYLKTIPRTANLLGLTSLVLLILKIFVLNKIPEKFNGAYELGLVVEAILASVIASYVFYLIVIHIKNVEDKKFIYPYVVRWAELVVADSKSQLIEIAKNSKIELPFDSLTEEQVNQAFNRINPNSKAV